MSCERAEGLLDGYLDGELEAVRALEFERHAQECPVCTGELEAQQSLRARLRDADLYAPAPPSLRRTIRERLEPRPRKGAASAPRPGRWRWLAAAAVVTLVATASWVAFRGTRRGAPAAGSERGIEGAVAGWGYGLGRAGPPAEGAVCPRLLRR